jgi:hypothetical protein
MTLQSRPETPEEFGERLRADCLSRPDFYFARRRSLSWTTTSMNSPSSASRWPG